jgi:hypothetical protein
MRFAGMGVHDVETNTKLSTLIVLHKSAQKVVKKAFCLPVSHPSRSVLLAECRHFTKGSTRCVRFLDREFGYGGSLRARTRDGGQTMYAVPGDQAGKEVEECDCRLRAGVNDTNFHESNHVRCASERPHLHCQPQR